MRQRFGKRAARLVTDRQRREDRLQLGVVRHFASGQPILRRATRTGGFFIDHHRAASQVANALVVGGAGHRRQTEQAGWQEQIGFFSEEAIEFNVRIEVDVPQQIPQDRLLRGEGSTIGPQHAETRYPFAGRLAIPQPLKQAAIKPKRDKEHHQHDRRANSRQTERRPQKSEQKQRQQVETHEDQQIDQIGTNASERPGDLVLERDVLRRDDLHPRVELRFGAIQRGRTGWRLGGKVDWQLQYRPAGGSPASKQGW